MQIWTKTKQLIFKYWLCYEQFWTSPGDSIPQNSCSMATYYPSRKLPKLDEPDMQDTAGEVRTNSSK